MSFDNYAAIEIAEAANSLASEKSGETKFNLIRASERLFVKLNNQRSSREDSLPEISVLRSEAIDVLCKSA